MDSTPEYPVEQPRGSWMPLGISLVAGLLVVGLLVTMMLNPAAPGAGPGVAGGVAAAPVSTIANSGVTGAPSEGVRIGALAPDFTLGGLKGGQVQLSSYRGAKAVWINFWATWCTYCKVEMPEMQTLYNSYKDRGVEFLGVDDAEQKEWVQPYVDSRHYTWNFILDLNGQVSRQYQVTGLPTHVFIGRDGVIKDLVVGSIAQDRMEADLAKIVTP